MKFHLTQKSRSWPEGYKTKRPRLTPQAANIARINLKKMKQRTKVEVFSWYGSACVCCDETYIDFLTLDHINDDAIREGENYVTASGKCHQQRRTGYNLYCKIRMSGYDNRPRDIQILCFNCQWGKRLNAGFCPHHPKKDLRII